MSVSVDLIIGTTVQFAIEFRNASAITDLNVYKVNCSMFLQSDDAEVAFRDQWRCINRGQWTRDSY